MPLPPHQYLWGRHYTPAYDWAQLWHTIRHRTVMTIITCQMCTGEEGAGSREEEGNKINQHTSTMVHTQHMKRTERDTVYAR